MNILPHLKHSDLGGSSSHFIDLHEGHVFTAFGSTPSVSIHLWPHLKHFSLNVSLSHDLDLHLGHCSGCSILLFQTYPHLRQVNLGIFGSLQLRDLHLGHLTGFSEPRDTQAWPHWLQVKPLPTPMSDTDDPHSGHLSSECLGAHSAPHLKHLCSLDGTSKRRERHDGHETGRSSERDIH
jgi:hypothetical protein